MLSQINPLNAKLNPICHLLALLGAHHIFYVSGVRVKCQRSAVKTEGSVCVPFVCSQCRTGPLRVGYVVCHVTDMLLGFIHFARSFLFVGGFTASVRLSVCRNGADINTETLQTCRKRRRYYLCLLLGLLTQSDLYCYQREFFH